MRFTI
jgi:hypothetical protein